MQDSWGTSVSKPWYLYVITNLVNDKQYIGITHRAEKRRREHYSGHGSKLVKQAIRKYGQETLDFEVWYEGSESWIKMMEQRAVIKLGTIAPLGYNLTLGGEGSVGVRPSEETKAKMSVAHSGCGNGMYGRTHSDATKHKISDAHKGKVCSPETLARLANVKGSDNPRAKPVTIKGVQYGCIKDAAEALNMNASNLRSKIAKYGADSPHLFRTHGEALRGRVRPPIPNEIKQKLSEKAKARYSTGDHPANRRVLVQNTEYESLKAAAHAIGLNYSTLKDRFQRYRLTGVWPDGYADLQTTTAKSGQQV